MNALEDADITRCLDTRAFYVCPRVNPDGAELAMADKPKFIRSSTRPYPYDEDPIGGLVLSHFGMDTSLFLLRIPVWKGSMAFQFGREIVPVDFARDGIYELTFSEDWNRISDMARIGDLAGDRYRYVQRTEGER